MILQFTCPTPHREEPKTLLDLVDRNVAVHSQTQVAQY